MEFTPAQREYIDGLASDVIDRMTEISTKAAKALSGSSLVSSDVLAFPNAAMAATSLARIRQSNRAMIGSYRHLTTEPVLARVCVMDSNNQPRTYYICRTTPVSGVANLASYRSPVGRLASLAIGDSVELPNGDELEIEQRALLNPETGTKGWDSRQTTVETESFGPITVPSLREFLELFDNSQQVADILVQIEAEERLKEALVAGLQRSVITKMGLRDQPILNSIQDSIFRMPIDRQVILLGPPGTGKTTTLIRRLGQKLDQDYLTADEATLVEAARVGQRLGHEESWLMFTPTKLLRLYLKEAFAREQVPAPDARIQTWDDHRRTLSKNVFGILRGATGSGYVLRPDSPHLSAEALTDSIGWFDDYFSWQSTEYQRELSEAADALGLSAVVDARTLATSLQLALGAKGWNALMAEVPKVQSFISGVRDFTDERIKDALKDEHKKDNQFIDTLARFLDTVGQESEARSEEMEEGDGADDEEEAVEQALTPRAKAIKRYTDSLRARARALAAKRTLDKSSINGKVLAWLGNRRLADDVLTEIGHQLLAQSHARRFISPVNRYLDGFQRRYGKFRKTRQAEGRWYAAQPIESRDIHPLELDIIILGILRAARDFLSRAQIVSQIDEPSWSRLRPVFDLYRNQILVDEAADFSPVQLACMAGLAHPTTRSFFACGDFNQRLTTWGTRSREEANWVMPGLEYQEVNIAYRQTRQLNTLARDIVNAVGGSNPIVELPKNVDNEGVAPALLEDAGDLAKLTSWLAARLGEVEEFLKGQPMPSTAIFVNSEEDVIPLAESLDRLLIEHNLRVVACSQGQIVGQDSDIRVFDIQHIKGLEFEAVFFVGVDSLAEKQPELFDKYLYVGATRAATYLGVTCDWRLPTVIEPLRAQFTRDWSAPHSFRR